MDTSKWTVDQWLAAAAQCGLAGRRNPLDPFTSLYPEIATRNAPRNVSPDFPTVVEASLIARGLIYFKNSPGDCGTPTPLDLENASFAKAGGSVASSGLSLGLGLAGIGGAAAGAATAGLSVAITAVVEIFTHHAEAVANEQATICKVAGVTNQIIPHIDRLVATGAISPADGVGQMENFVEQLNAQLGTIEKTCNAACFYQGVMDAHADFVKTYYPALAPPQIAPVAPFSPPVADHNAPGGVPLIAAPIAHTLSGVPAVAGFVLTTQDLMIGAIVLLIVFIFISMRRRTNGQG